MPVLTWIFRFFWWLGRRDKGTGLVVSDKTLYELKQDRRI
jgi:hypothetical protein